MFTSPSRLIVLALLAVVVLIFGTAIGIVPISPVTKNTLGLMGKLYLSDVPAPAPAANTAERLKALDQTLYPATVASTATAPQINRQLWNLNEMLYPSSSSESTFWSGRPH